MSQRGKSGKRHLNRNDEGLAPAKRRKGRPKAAPTPEDEDEGWTARNVTDIKSNTIYNQRAPEAPAELFRKDLISAMKLPDSEPLNSDEYWIISDQWKQEWERGVQVPVNPDSLPQPLVSRTHHPQLHSHQFKLPKSKYIRITKDDKHSSDEIHLSSVAARAEAACHYDLDDADTSWLTILNGERALMGLPPLTEDQLERILEELERRCWDKIQGLVKAEEGLGIEFDENVICDVCRSPDSEEGNEMVFCDSCNICVHQACYGITSIPDGSWLCRTCALSKRPECVLCPNKGGAMKCTKSGQEWAHVSCALWIPEVSIGCVEKMEPITKISNIPQSRWALICVLCRERVGACIQCSVKTCKTAYHVTCAFKHGLEMRAIIEDENADDGVKLRSYCQKHSVKKENRNTMSDDEDSKRKKKKDMTSEEKNQARAAKLHEIEAEFYKHVSVSDISGSAALLEVDPAAIESVYNYWKLKRRSGLNRPLLPPRSDDADLLSRRQEQQDLDKLKMFVQLRQDLERVRNLCYMVSRREKLSRTFFRTREQTFHKQAALLSNSSSLTQVEISAILEANHGPSIYDKLYSNPAAADHSEDFDRILARIEGVSSSDLKARQDLNGLIKSDKNKLLYVNGTTTTRRRRSLFGSSTDSESDSHCRKNKFSSLGVLGLNSADSSSEDDKKSNLSRSLRNSRRKGDNKPVYTSSSDEKWTSPRSRTLRQLEKERERELNKSSSEDSDDLLPLPKSDNTKVSTIYSDSDSEASIKDDKSWSSQHILRTKAAMKEFSGLPKVGKENKKQTTTSSTRSARNRKHSVKKESELEDEYFDKENVKSGKKDVEANELIVPQRQAAKKASESIRCFQGKKEEAGDERVKDVDLKDAKNKSKSKIKDEKASSRSSAATKDDELTDKEDTLSYVPQRQAAKKAAETIKCGMKPTDVVVADNKKKEPLQDNKKLLDKDEVAKRKQPKASSPVGVKSPKTSSSKASSGSSSSGSSSSSSCSSTSSSSSESEDDKPLKLEEQTTKSIFDPEPKKKSDDWPFLDRGDQSDDGKKFKKAADKKLKTSDRRPEIEFQPPTLEREESRKRSLGDRVSATRSGDISENSRVRKRKSSRSPFSSSEPEEQRHETINNKFISSPAKKTGKEIDDRRSPRDRKTGKEIDDRRSPRDRKTGKEIDDRRSPRDRKTGKDKQVDKEVPVKRRPGRPRKDSCKTSDTPDKKSPRLKQEQVDVEDREVENDEKKDTTTPSKAKPMPKCRKKELGLLDDDNKPTPVEGVRRSSRHSTSDSVNFDKKNDISNIVQNNNNNNNNINNKSEVSAGVMEVAEVKEVTEVVEVAEKTKQTATTSTCEQESSSFGLDLGLSEQVAGEPKKVSSRTSSLGVSSYQHRSIFSPQVPKDNLADIFDFENDILAVDETVHEEQRPSLPLFNFNNEFLFKEDSKEDSKRETYNLVEKLRLEYAKKCSSGQSEDVSHELKEEKQVNVDSVQSEQAAGEVEQEQFLPDNQINKISTPTSVLPPPTPGYQLDNHSQPEPSPAQTQGSNTSHCSPMTPQQKTPQTGDGYHQKPLQDIQNYQNVEMKNHQESSPNNFVAKQQQHQQQGGAGYVEQSPVSGAPSVYQQQPTESTFDTFYEPCPPVQHDSNKLPVPQGQEKLERCGASDERWVPPSANTQQPVYPSPSDTQYHSESPYTQGGNNQWAENDVLPSRRSSTSSVTSSESSREQDYSQQQQPSAPQHPPPQTGGGVDGTLITQELHNKIVEAIKADGGKHCDMLQFQPNLAVAAAAAAAAVAAAAAAKNDENMPYPHTQDLYHPVLPPFLADNAPFHPYSEASPFVGPVPMLPYPTPSTPMFPPPPFPPPFTPSHSLLALPKSLEENLNVQTPCGATFTSSQHNMAVVSAMVSPPSVTSLTPDHSTFQSGQQTPIQSPRTPLTNTTSAQNKKPAAKPTRMSARVISQSKSPGKSPRQQVETPTPPPAKTTPARVREPPQKRNRNVNNSQKGRARSRGGNKGRGSAYDDFVIRTKLSGTVYDLDFDEDGECESVENLRAMRERRRSTDMHERKQQQLQLQQSSPPTSHHNKRYTSTDVRDVAPPTPAKVPQVSPAAAATRTSTPVTTSPAVAPPAATTTTTTQEQPSSIAQTSFPDVAPLLPGPVDMRTYLEPAANTVEYHNHLLGAFANPAEAPHVNDFDEEMEKELHSALTASRPRTQTPPVQSTPPAPTPQHGDSVEAQDSLTKVSLTDSRNQLKVKIKGPFLDANYAAANTTLPAPQPAVTAVGSAVSGTSNLRRMRKKELLRHWTQDMNMDDPLPAVTPAAAPPPSRTIITIPKAVASMTSIPTRDDYKALIDANMDKKKKKKDKPNSVSARELRGLDMTFPPPDDEPGTPERRASTGSNASLSLDGVTPKRRARMGKPNQPQPSTPLPATTPKLKIKFGGNDVQLDDKKNLRVRPPKKRPCDIVMPSFEEYKRESMEYRKKIMQDFDEDEKVKVKVKLKKKKKKVREESRKVQLVEDYFTTAPKIIIKFGKPDGAKEKLTVEKVQQQEAETVQPAQTTIPEQRAVPPIVQPLEDVDPLAIDPLEIPTEEPPPAVVPQLETLPSDLSIVNVEQSTSVGELRKVRTSKPTPIRLKISRCEEGYVMSGKENDSSTNECNNSSTECPVR